jgi:membrane protease subunit (stomatin/prohibitin family)
MGLFRLIGDVVGGGWNALKGTTQSTMWKEYFESGDMSNGVLMKRGEKILVNGGKNRRADNNLISSGSGIDVQEGQCMIIVDNGKVVEFCAEPGRYTYDSSSQPSLFSGNNKGLKAFGKEILNQWSAGGQRFSTQRVYFINLGELIQTPIKWGCGDIAFHHTQQYATGVMELDITLRGNGQATIQITDPVKFFKTIGAQVTGTDGDGLITINDSGILSNLKSNIVDNVAMAIETLGTEQPVAYTGIRSKGNDIKNIINNLIVEYMYKFF